MEKDLFAEAKRVTCDALKRTNEEASVLIQDMMKAIEGGEDFSKLEIKYVACINRQTALRALFGQYATASKLLG